MVDVSLLVTFGSQHPHRGQECAERRACPIVESVIGLKIGGVNVHVSGIDLRQVIYKLNMQSIQRDGLSPSRYFLPGKVFSFVGESSV